MFLQASCESCVQMLDASRVDFILHEAVTYLIPGTQSGKLAAFPSPWGLSPQPAVFSDRTVTAPFSTAPEPNTASHFLTVE